VPGTNYRSIPHRDAFIALKVEVPALNLAQAVVHMCTLRNGGCPYTIPPELRNGGSERQQLGFRMSSG
jgi:hypothetical protein